MKFAVVVAVIMVTSAGCHRDVEVDRPDCDSAVCQLADRLADVGGGVIIGGEAPIGDVSLLGGTASTFAPTGSLLFDDRERVIWTVREGNVVEAINIAEATSSKVSIGPRVEFAGVLHSGGCWRDPPMKQGSSTRFSFVSSAKTRFRRQRSERNDMSRRARMARSSP